MKSETRTNHCIGQFQFLVIYHAAWILRSPESSRIQENESSSILEIEREGQPSETSGARREKSGQHAQYVTLKIVSFLFSLNTNLSCTIEFSSNRKGHDSKEGLRHSPQSLATLPVTLGYKRYHPRGLRVSEDTWISYPNVHINIHVYSRNGASERNSFLQCIILFVRFIFSIVEERERKQQKDVNNHIQIGWIYA